MAPHDAYARLTPFELAFPDQDSFGDLVARVLEEAAARGADAGDPQGFLMLGSVGAFLQELKGPDSPPEAVHEYGALLYHAHHFERAGRPIFLLDTHVVRRLVDGGAWHADVRVPCPAGYVQLPRHLVWMRPPSDLPAEAIDGFFWTLGSGGQFHALVAAGMRSDRPGLAVYPLPDAPWADVGAWLSTQARKSGPDFANALPGGELEGLLAIEAAGEVLKLAARLFAYLGTFPEAAEPAAPYAGVPVAHGVPASALPYVRVSLRDG
jgi:hypothetical protein